MINRIKRYYKKAKRVALVAHDNVTKAMYHVFSVIELLPEDIPSYSIPTKDWHQNKTIRTVLSQARDEYSFYLVVNDISSVEDAISRFESPLSSNVFDGDTYSFFNQGFLREPTSSFPIVLPSNIYDNEGLGSILPKRNSGLFVWSQIDHERKVQNLFRGDSITKAMKAMSQLTMDWLGFDIWSKSEHIGNVYLCAPNPYFRDMDISLSTDPVGIYYSFKMRKGVDERLSLRVIDVHGDNIALDRLYPLDKYQGLLQLPHEPHLCELRIYNSSNDLVATKPPVTFIKSLHFGLSMKQADFHVKWEDSTGNKEFVVEKFAKEIPTVVGSPTSFNAPYYFKQAAESRKHVINEKDKTFIFFPGGKSPEEKTRLKVSAKSAIRDIINLTKDACYLCDPYFNVNDLIDYAFHTRDSGVTIRIINCKGNRFVDKKKAAALHAAITEYNAKPFQKIECRMLRGDSILHDRFLISDMNVWFLGSSYSEFGNRATCLAKVPTSSDVEILKEVEKWYFNKTDNYSQLLEDYINGDSDE
jgi:hypothetical protein